MGDAARRPARAKASAAGRGWRALRSFFGERIWRAHRVELGRGQAALYHVARLLQVTAAAVWSGRLHVRAAALTYYSVLSLVPFLAFAFAVLKGLGAYQLFVEGTVRPYLNSTFAANPALLRAFDQVLGFVARTDVSRLGVAGLLLLVYTTVSMLGNIEDALNQSWGVKHARSFLRQVTDYLTFVVVTPILIVVAVTLGTAAQSSGALRFARDTLGLGRLIDLALRSSSVVVACVAMFTMYVVMPNTRTRLRSALIGALVSGVLWQLALTLHINAQSSVARFNALYSGFAALPIFLVWLYVSWLVALVGAELAAAHQHEEVLVQRHQLGAFDQELRETIGLAVAARVARAFMAGAPRWTAAGLARELQVPEALVDETVAVLVDHGVLARTAGGPAAGLVPARDLDDVRVLDVLHALRRDGGSVAPDAAARARLGPAVVETMRSLEAELQASRHNVTLRALGAATPAPRPAASDDEAAAAPEPAAPAGADPKLEAPA